MDTFTLPTYDVFISYSPADRAWVRSTLLPYLAHSGLKVCIDEDHFQPGAARALEIERAITTSRHTLLVLSPAYLQSTWATFESLLLQTLDVGNQHHRLIPLLYQPCAMPLRISYLVMVDLADGDQAAWTRLLDALGAQVAPRPSFDVIPAPMPLPSGSRIAYARNPLFVGREGELRTLAQLLLPGSGAGMGVIAAVSGLGGMGKTQLAVEFVHRYGMFFRGGVFWLSFADAANVPTEIAACGEEMALSLADQPLQQQVRQVQRRWSESIPRLLVFDTCEDEALLDQWRPRTGGCAVLLTTRRAHWRRSLGVQLVPLEVLPRAISTALLRQHRPDLIADDPMLDALAAAVGDLPLALHLAGSYLDRYQRSTALATYVAQLQSPHLLQHPCFQSAEVLPTAHSAHVARSFTLSYDHLDPTDPTDSLARTLLAHAICFAPGEPIPLGLLATTITSDDQQQLSPQQEAALHRLVAVGLVDHTATTLRLHQLIHSFLVSMMPDDTAQPAVEIALIMLAKRSDQDGSRILVILERHVRYLVAQLGARRDLQAATLCAALGSVLHSQGDYEAAQPLLERSLACHVEVLGWRHLDTVQQRAELGLLYHAQGRYAAARPLLEQALTLHLLQLGPDDPRTAASQAALGFLCHATSEYGTARLLLEQALATQQRHLLPDDLHITTTQTHLGMTLQALGALEAARPLLEQALATRERVLGAEHPLTATSLTTLAYLRSAIGETASALVLYEQALAVRQHVLGATHPLTATSLHNLAYLKYTLGDAAAALPLYTAALAIREQILGPDHPVTATCLHNFARALHATGQTAQARSLMEHALTIREQTLGPDHLLTATSLQHLAALMSEQGQTEAARPLLERALQITLPILGAEHTTTQALQAQYTALLS